LAISVGKNTIHDNVISLIYLILQTLTFSLQQSWLKGLSISV